MDGTPLPRKTSSWKSKKKSSKNKLSQKKLKSAINVSLNTSHNLRSLRFNNHSLAQRLESIKKECRAAFDAYQSLQEENHLLRQRLVSLECIINDPDSYIEEQINERFEAHKREIKYVTQLLQENVLGFSSNLRSLDEICSSSNQNIPSGEKKQRNKGSMDRILTQEPHYLPFPSSLRNLSIEGTNNYSQDVTTHAVDDDMNEAFDELDDSVMASGDSNESFQPGKSALEKNQDMSMILEKTAILGNCSPVSGIAKRTKSMTEISVALPHCLSTRSKERQNEASDKDGFDTHGNNVRKTRRTTRVLSEDEINVLGIMDAEPPLDLVLSPQILSSSGDGNEQHPGPYENPKENFTSGANENNQHVKKSKLKKQKQVSSKQKHTNGKNNEIFISNEFDLNNLHRQMTEKLKVLEKEDFVANEKPCNPIPIACDNTVLTEEDMELTLPFNGDGNISNFIYNKAGTSISDNCSHEQPDCEEICPEAVTLQRMKPGQMKFAAARKETDGSRKSLLSHPPRARSKSKKAIAEMIENLPQEKPKSIFDFHDKTPTQIQKKDIDASIYNLRDESSIMSPVTPLSKKRRKTSLAVGRRLEDKELSVESEIFSLLSEESHPPSFDLLNNEKVTVRNSRSRSHCKSPRDKPQSGVKSPNVMQQIGSSDISKETGQYSTLGEGMTYSVLLKDDSDNKDMGTLSNSRSRNRVSRARSKSRGRHQSTDEQSTISDEMTEKISARKSRGKSCSRAKPLTTETGEHIELNNETEPDYHSEKLSVLGGGDTYFVSLKDDDNNDEKKSSERNSRSQSRNRAFTRTRSKSRGRHHASDQQSNDTEETLDSEKTEKITARKSRGRSRSRTDLLSTEETGVPSKHDLNTSITVGNEKESVLHPEHLSVLGAGDTYSVPLIDDDKEKSSERKPRSQSRSRAASRARSKSRGRPPVTDQPSTSTGEILDSENTKNITERKSLGRSRSRAKPSSGEADVLSKQDSKDTIEVGNEKESILHPGKASVLGDGGTYSVPLIDDDKKKYSERKSRSPSRSRAASRARSKSRGRLPVTDQRSTSTGETLDTEDAKNISERKSLGRPRSRAKPSSGEADMLSKQDLNDSIEVGNEKESILHPVKASVLGDGDTYSIPLKDDDKEKSSERNPRSQSRSRAASRARSKSRGRTPATDQQLTSSNEAVDNGKEHVIYSEQMSMDKETITNVPLNNDSKNVEISAKKPKGILRKKVKPSTAEQPPVGSMEASSEIIPTVECEKGTSLDLEQMSVLGDGEIFSVSLKEDNTGEKDKASENKSKFQSRNIASRARSKSRGRDHVGEEQSLYSEAALDERKESLTSSEGIEVIKTSVRKSKGTSRKGIQEGESICRSRSRSPCKSSMSDSCPVLSTSRIEHNSMHIASSTESCREIAVASPRESRAEVKEVFDVMDVHVHEKVSPSPRKKAMLKKDDVFPVDPEEIVAKSPKRKTPSKLKLQKKAVSSKKKIKTCKTKLKTSSLKLEEDSVLPMKELNVCLGKKKIELFETNDQCTTKINKPHDNIPDTLPGSAVKVSAEKNLPSKSNKADNLCASKCGDTLSKTVVDVDSKTAKDNPGKGKKRKRRDPDFNPKESTRQNNACKKDDLKTEVFLTSSISFSPSKSSATKKPSAVKETKADNSFGELRRQRRTASKAISYAEPSLNVKMRRGDTSTSVLEKARVYKSPSKVVKKTKVTRDVLSSLQNQLLEEETGDQ